MAWLCGDKPCMAEQLTIGSWSCAACTQCQTMYPKIWLFQGPHIYQHLLYKPCSPITGEVRFGFQAGGGGVTGREHREGERRERRVSEEGKTGETMRSP